jgi:hypothetical protein
MSKGSKNVENVSVQNKGCARIEGIKSSKALGIYSENRDFRSNLFYR